MLTKKYSTATTVQIFSEGSEIPNTYGVLFVQVNKDINKISTAKIRLRDGGIASNASFAVSENDKFKHGKKIKIKVGHAPDKTAVIFEGIVVKQGLKVASNGIITLDVECKHPAVKLSTVRKTAIYKDKKDSEKNNKRKKNDDDDDKSVDENKNSISSPIKKQKINYKNLF